MESALLLLISSAGMTLALARGKRFCKDLEATASAIATRAAESDIADDGFNALFLVLVAEVGEIALLAGFSEVGSYSGCRHVVLYWWVLKGRRRSRFKRPPPQFCGFSKSFLLLAAATAYGGRIDGNKQSESQTDTQVCSEAPGP
jgi:hypothetical protein